MVLKIITQLNTLAQTPYDEVRKGFLDPGYAYIYLIIGSIFVGIVGIIALILTLINRKKQRQAVIESNIKRFEGMCHEHNLTNKEINFLKHIIRSYKVKNPLDLFKNKSRLNSFLEKELMKYEQRYTRGSYEIQQVKEMVNHIIKQYDYVKPGKGELLKSSRDLRAGQRIFIFQRNFKTKKPILGNIIYIDDNYIAAIFYNVPEILDNVDTGSKIEVTFNREDDANYFFSSRVLKIIRKHSEKGHSHVVVLKHSDKLYRTQKRKYTRLKIDMPVILYPQNQSEKVSKNDSIVCTGIDISQGGICVESPSQFPVDTFVRLDFTMVVDYNDILAQIVGVNKKREYYHLHMKFSNMEPELRDNIRKYVMTRTSNKIF